MQSKTSFSNTCHPEGGRRPSRRTPTFNRTVFRKNLTRFAPILVLYGLFLGVFLLMCYSDTEYSHLVGFAHDFSWSMVEIFMYWNLAYALLTAQLLFGDLYNSRMCNALHAMPLRRESWFVTNFLSGLAFSAIPTFIAALVVLPMLTSSVVENAWALAALWFLSSNLEFICCFGLASFAALCVGSRLTMAAGYGLLNFGAYIAYWLVDTVYTPMLYGVITPTRLANALTPSAHAVEYHYIEMENMLYEYELAEQGKTLADLAVRFRLTEHWWRLFALAGVGIVFAVLALLLYRKRNLECAGDAVAFPILKPVFQVLCALFVMCAGKFVLGNMFGLVNYSILILALGLAIGWFVGEMLIERTTRVFRPKNWVGLGALMAVFAVTLAGTHFDVLNIEERMPDRDKIAAVRYETSGTQAYEMEEENWDDILRIHELAIADRVENIGLYVIDPDGTRTRYPNAGGYEIVARDVTNGMPNPGIDDLFGYEDYVLAGNVRITYEMKDGSTMRRRYNIWTDGETGDLTRKALSSWEILTDDKTEVGGKEMTTLEAAMDSFLGLYVSGYSEEDPILQDKQKAQEFLEAVEKDCDLGLMIQDSDFHRGVFYKEVEDRYGERYIDYQMSIWVQIEARNMGWSVRISPECTNSVQWLLDNGLIDYDIADNAVVLPG